MARERPIKLHIKDGKDTTFRLIGPKGRVLNSLNWDGERLELKDAFNDEDVPEALDVSKDMEEAIEINEKLDESESEDKPEMEMTEEEDPAPEPPVQEGDENLQDILGDAPPASPADAPEPKGDSKPEIGEAEGVEDVSGESEAVIQDDELADILAEETTLSPDIEESDEVPEDKDSKSDNVEENKKPY